MANQYSQFLMPYQEPYVAPKLTAVQWEDEKTYCFQVESRGVTVARRKDSDFINGTKLLNVVGMTRGKRDGILKNEQGRVVIKSGSMMLKGVWIPLQRASELAREHGVFEMLYPLFESDIESFYYSPMVSLSSHPIDIELSSSRWAQRTYRTFPPALTLPPISADMGYADMDQRFCYDSTPTDRHFPQDLTYEGYHPMKPECRQGSDLGLAHSPFFATTPVAYTFFPNQPPTTPVSPTSCPNPTEEVHAHHHRHQFYYPANQQVPRQHSSLVYHA